MKGVKALMTKFSHKIGTDEDHGNHVNHMKTKQKTADHISGPTLAEQYVVIADYQKADKWDLNLKAGMVLEVVEKSDSGWWFVNVDDKQGWVPSSYLERKDGLKENTAIRTNLGEDERYISTASYTPQNEDEISLEKGTVVEVLEKNLDGWWFVRSNSQEGIAPSTYLIKTETAHIERVARASGVQIIGRMSEVSDIMRHDTHSSESLGDTRGGVQHIMKKQRSLERGGSLRPPPRLNSITKASDDVMNSFCRTDNHYVTISEFTDTVGDGISFSQGEVVEVLEKSDSGWWFVKINGKEGWAPEGYIGKTSINDIEEEEDDEGNVYHDIGDIDETIEDSDNDDGVYETPEPSKYDDHSTLDDQKPSVQDEQKPSVQDEIKNAIQMRIKSNINDTNLKRISDKVVTKRPVSKPPPPPIPLKIVTVDTDDNSPRSLKSPTAGAPLPPPKKPKSKPAITSNDESTGNKISHEILKPKLSADRPPQPPPKKLKQAASGTQGQDKPESTVQMKSPLAEFKSKLSKSPEEKKDSFPVPESKTKYKYTDVIPKDQRPSSPESLIGVLKSKLGHIHHHSDLPEKNRNVSHGEEVDKKSPITSPRAEKGNRGFVLPPKKPVTPPRTMSPKVQKKFGHVEEKQDEQENNVNVSMNELKSKFEKQSTDTSKKPVLKHKNVTNSHSKSNLNKGSEEKSSLKVDEKPSAKASALKAMFEHQMSDNEVNKKKVVHKTNSNSSTGSKTAGIAAMLNSKFENDKPILKPHVNRSDNSSSRPPLLPSKNKENSKPQPTVPHKPLGPKNSNPPSLPARTGFAGNLKPKLPVPQKPSNVDRNHNEMGDSKSDNITDISRVSGKKQSDISEPPTPPEKDYEKLSNFSSCYKTAIDFISEGEGQVGFIAGESVEVIEQTEDWWYIRVHGDEGWAPAAYIGLEETVKSDDVFCKQYRAVSDFISEAEGELEFCTGDILDVLEETDTGWWFVKKGNLEGWAPSAYLEQV